MIQQLVGSNLVGRYAVKRLVGRGTAATVYDAHDMRLERRVALKVFDPRFVSQQGFAFRFHLEGQTLARLVHPNVVPVFDLVENSEAGLYCLVLGYVSGGTLRSSMGRKPVGVVQAIETLRSIADALDYVHAQRPPVVHGTLTPANVLRTADYRVVVTDFGVMRILAAGRTDGQLVGTPTYMAPEQAKGHLAGPEADRYALGLIAYELLTGSVPFQDASRQGLLIKVARDPLPPPRSRNPHLDHAVERVLVRALAKDPNDRFAHAHAFLDALQVAGSGATVPPMAGRTLMVQGSPASASVVIDGEYVGSVPCTVANLPPGAHLVSVTADGHQAEAIPVVLPRTEPLTMALQRQAYSLSLAGSPAGAAVYKDGKNIGTLPCAVTHLAAGPVVLTVTAPGYLPWERTVAVPPDAAFSVELQPIRPSSDETHQGDLRADADASVRTASSIKRLKKDRQPRPTGRRLLLILGAVAGAATFASVGKLGMRAPQMAPTQRSDDEPPIATRDNTLTDATVVRAPNGPVYILKGGLREWVPDMEAFASLGLTNEHLVHLPAEAVRAYPLAAVREGMLLKGSAEHIYYVQDGTRRWIRSMETFSENGFDLNLVHYVADRELWSLPEGPELLIPYQSSQPASRQ